ncbi:MAG: cytochrome b/b6 domain-containing protein [Coriobacteriia bacterium]|nr:cytochrome b/b6 domain-containing protein [Coriobacteriia bacterium]
MRYIQRHSALKRWIHGIHTVSCMTLLVTGTLMFVPSIAGSISHGTLQGARLLHRIMGVVFIAAPLAGLAVAPSGLVHMMKNLFARWDRDDRRFMAMFPKYLFASKTTHMPKQHEVKSGQRLSDGLLIAASVLIALTGVVLWGASFFGPTLVLWGLVLHDVAFVLVAMIMVAHVYLGAGVFQPYRGSWRLMFGNGRVSESDALYHWGHWAEEELRDGSNVVEA